MRRHGNGEECDESAQFTLCNYYCLHSHVPHVNPLLSLSLVLEVVNVLNSYTAEQYRLAVIVILNYSRDGESALGLPQW